TASPDLWSQARRTIDEGKPAEAICYLAELVSTSPQDKDARLQLALSLGDAGHPAGALKVIRLLGDRLVHEGYLLPAIAVVHRGLQSSANDKGLIATLERLHVRGAHAKAGKLAVPPALPPRKKSTAAATSSELITLAKEERLARVAEVGADFPPQGPPGAILPLPLFGELDTSAFIATLRLLKYKRVQSGVKIIEEGAPGDSLIVLISGQVTVSKKGTELGKLSSGAVLGEMALITRAPRSATVMATEEVEYFELGRSEVSTLTKNEPKVMQELAAYCRSRLLMNLLRTSPLFSHFDETTRMSLLGRFRTITIGSGDQVIQAGQTGEGLYVIATGRAQVQARDADGKSHLVATLGPGDVFGEISLIKKRPATADVIAIETLGAIFLPAADFQQVLAEFPEVHAFLDSLSDKRISATQAQVGDVYVDPDDLVVL
ncbi:MAG: cyclic nucleotide-binding domain-containing protein, partial [Clostridia bacterium]|nr:cyclic nucleotide-binding domain-containing protein [Deltaproteobacteria bacterium]